MDVATTKQPWTTVTRELGVVAVRRWVRGLAWILAVGALGSGLIVARDQLARERAQLGEPPELVYAPPAAFLEVVSLGYRHALANVLWFRTIDYFGRHYRKDRLYPWLAEMCDRVTDLDPAAEHVYRFGGVILPWEANDIDAGIALLEKGVRNLPQSWSLRYMLGFSYYFFRDDLEAASRELRTALTLPGAPGFLAGLLAVVDSAHRGPEAALQFLEAALQSAAVPEVRETIQQQIRELEFARAWGTLESALSQYRRAFGHPPPDLDALVHAGVLDRIPADPFGGQFTVDPDSGQLRSSSGRTPKKLGSSKMREAILKGKRASEAQP